MTWSAHASSAGPHRPEAKVRRILVIDDNEDIHADFVKVFERSDRMTTELDALELELLGEGARTSAGDSPADVSVDGAMQGELGVEKVQRAIAASEPYDVVFLDVRMPPGMDGIETAKKLWEIDGDLKIALCTAYSDYSWSEIRRQLPRHDQLMILRKPFAVAEVRDLVFLRWG